jgi:hypothetical protein
MRRLPSRTSVFRNIEMGRCPETDAIYPYHTRFIAGLSGFFVLIHVRTRPER